jgi:large subunit ribosomal protein L19
MKAMSDLIKAVEAPENTNLPELNPGDSISVHFRIREGERERVQEFKGVVIRIRKGGNNANVTVRHKIEIQRRAHVRRSKLYYLRDRTGKRARLKEKRH